MSVNQGLTDMLTGAPFGINTGGYGAYATTPGGGISGIGAAAQPGSGTGAGGVFSVDPQTGMVNRSIGPTVGWGIGNGGQTPPYAGYGQGAADPGSVANMQQWIAANPNSPRPGGDAGLIYDYVRNGTPVGTPTMTPSRSNGPQFSYGGGAGGYGGGSGGSSTANMDALAAMGQRRLGEQATEQRNSLNEDYQRRGLTQSGLLSTAMEKQTRQEGYALADFLAQLYGRGAGGGGSPFSMGMQALGGFGQRGQGQQQQGGNYANQSLAEAWAEAQRGQGLSPDIEALLRSLQQMMGGGGAGSDGYGANPDAGGFVGRETPPTGFPDMGYGDRVAGGNWWDSND